MGISLYCPGQSQTRQARWSSYISS
jgi:hypothetical protein